MDDIVILGNDLGQLREDFVRLEEFSLDRLGMKMSHWHAQPTSQGINFVGYRIWPTHKLLRQQSVIRAKRRIKACIEHNDADGLQKFIGSWSGHAMWADANNLFTWLEANYAITFD